MRHREITHKRGVDIIGPQALIKSETELSRKGHQAALEAQAG
jgi:hypothetical protein